MSPRFFLDHCVASSVAKFLDDADYEVIRLTRELPADSPDPVVIARSQSFDAILVTNNGDFSDLITYPPSKFGGIVALQIHNRPQIIAAMVQRLLAYCQDHPDRDHYRGKLFLIEAHRIRLRE